MTAPQLSQPIGGARAPVATATERDSRRGRSNLLQQIGFYVLIVLFIIFCLAPFIWTLDTSLKGPGTIFTTPVQYLPNPLDLGNYNKIFHLSRFTRSLLNSLIVASCATAISLLIGAVCAYALARLQFPGKNFILALVLAIAMFPGIAIIGPLFRQFNCMASDEQLPGADPAKCHLHATLVHLDAQCLLPRTAAGVGRVRPRGRLHADADLREDRRTARGTGCLHRRHSALHSGVE